MKLATKMSAMLGVLGLSVALSASAVTTAEEKIIERIKPAGNVCVEGDDSCGGAVAAAATSAGGARSGEDVYKASCSVCHATGVAGAPKYANATEWNDRAAKGLDSLLSTAISGINAMPPRGTCNDCSDEELQAAIEYMLDSIK